MIGAGRWLVRPRWRTGSGAPPRLNCWSGWPGSAVRRLESRLRLGRQTYPTTTLTGEPVPAEFDTVRRGLVSGRLGVDSAVLITRMLSRAKAGVPTDQLPIIRQAERELVCAAIGAAPDAEAPALPPVPPFETVIHLQAWEAVLNPDGTEPVDRFASRGFILRRPKDGLVPVTGLLTPEVAGQVQATLDALSNAHQSLKFLPAEHPAAAGTDRRHPGSAHPQPTSTRRVGRTIVDVAGRSGSNSPPSAGQPRHPRRHRPRPPPGHPSRRGTGSGVPLSGWASEPASAPHCPLQRWSSCPARTGSNGSPCCPTGKVYRLGTTERTFNRAQRRALAVRDGGCIICGLAPQYTEAHHVIPWAVEQRTHVDNGVLLCWYHHRTIHTSGWQIRMIDGAPEVKPPPGLGPPDWRPAPGSRVRQTAAITQRLNTQD